MNPDGVRRKKITYANVVSTLALVLAVSGGTAFAASKIKGNQIRRGTITAKNIKNHSLLAKDFKKGQLPRGAAGAAGAAGPAGPAGAKGAAGSAIATGTVLLNGAGNPSFVNNTGFGAVSSPQANVYCIVPPAGAVDVPILLSPVGGTNQIVQQISPQQCPNNYEVEASGPFGAGQGFTIVVP